MSADDVFFTTIGTAKLYLEEEVLGPGAPDEMECAVGQVHILASIACSLKKLAATPLIGSDLKGLKRMNAFFNETTFVAKQEDEE